MAGAPVVLPSMEHRGRTGTCQSPESRVRYGNDRAGKYHVFSLEGTPRQYVFRIDGKETCRSKKGVSGRHQFVILSLQSNSYEIPLLDGDPPVMSSWASFDS